MHGDDGPRGGRPGHVRSEDDLVRGGPEGFLLRARFDDDESAGRRRRDPVPLRDLLPYDCAEGCRETRDVGDRRGEAVGQSDRHGSHTVHGVLPRGRVPPGLLPEESGRRILPRHNRTEGREVPEALRGPLEEVTRGPKGTYPDRASSHLMTKNRLAKETSTYLKGAAHQPVDWYPWGEDAFRKAKELDRPVILDVGASWCHWCHVIDRESYEDPELAKVINENFVAVKVDRDERPDIDARYQQAVGALTNHGGWPLTAFLTPDGKVFYGGTYFPPRDTHGQPSFRRVLQTVADHFRTNKQEALRDAEALHQSLAMERTVLPQQGTMNEAALKGAYDTLRGVFDPVNGGFGTAPKFPHPGAMEFLMARYHRTREDGQRNIVVRTLRGMAQGGVYDQVGGGFHRYSTDARWIVPHFEKMLYDNAGLLANYVHGYRLTGEPFFREIAIGTYGYLRDALYDHDRGGFHASQDADIGAHDDGDYFTWTLEEAREALKAEP